MPVSSEQAEIARLLLREVCTVLAEHSDDAILVGGIVPEILFPTARPRHIGTMDVDVALRSSRAGYIRLVALLRQKGFHQGENGYQFFKDIALPHGHSGRARLDLLTSTEHHAAHFAGTRSDEAPEPIPGAKLAFADHAVRPVGGDIPLRVVGLVAFLVMKSLALSARQNEKDAYDIHFCLEQYQGLSEGVSHLEALAALFHPWRGDPLVEQALKNLADKFNSADADGPRIVADIDQLMGESRAIRKLQALTRVQEFLHHVRS